VYVLAILDRLDDVHDAGVAAQMVLNLHLALDHLALRFGAQPTLGDTFASERLIRLRARRLPHHPKGALAKLDAEVVVDCHVVEALAEDAPGALFGAVVWPIGGGAAVSAGP